MIYIWLLVSVTTLLITAVTGKYKLLYVMPGELAALVLSFLYVEAWIQLAVCAVLILLCLFPLRIFVIGRLGKPKQTNMDTIVGERCTVTERIENFAGIGQVKVGDMYWAARALDDQTVFEVGESVTVLAVEGVKLIVR